MAKRTSRAAAASDLPARRHSSTVAIALKDEQIPIGDGRFYDRHIGDVLHPERESKSDLDNIRSELGEEIFDTQNQGCPSQPTGQMI
jgi:hypothetical protein